MVYSQLGDVVFGGLIGPSTFTHDVEANYAEQQRIGDKPRLQKVGEGLVNISMSFKFHASFCDPEAQLAQLETYRADGEVVPYLRGDGRFEGNFVITSVQYSVNQQSLSGEFIDIDVNIKLKEYIEAGDENTQNQGFAVTDQDPVASLQDVRSIGDGAKVGEDLNTLFGGSGQINNSLRDAEIEPDSEPIQLAKVVKQADEMQTTVDKVEEGANKDSIFDISAELRAIITDIRDAITQIRDFAAVGDLTNTKLAAANFDIFKQSIRKAAAPIAANGSVRGS